MSYAIEIRNLTKKFPQPKSYRQILCHPFRKKEITALEDLNIYVREGELFGLLGPNGAGKTTLTKILCTLVLPTKGDAFVYGHDVTKDENEIKNIIGYVISEERSFYWRLTGRQNLRFFATLNNMSNLQARKKIEEVTGLVGLEDDLDKPFQNYSTGTKQRLAIARGLLTNPRILILDEPTKNLDPVATHNLRSFLKDTIVTKEKKTVLIATNNMQEAEELCDRIAILHKGKLKFCGSIERAKRILREKRRYILKVIGSFGRLQEKFCCPAFNGRVLSLLPDSAFNSAILTVQLNSDKENISELIEWLVMSGIKIEYCRRERLSLNEIFSSMID